MLDWVLAVVTVLTLCYWLTRKPHKFPPGPPILPFVGSLPFLESKNFHMSLERMRNKYGPVIGLKFGPLIATAICGPKEVEEVLRRDEFQGRPNINSGDDDDLRRGIMFTQGSFWVEQRRFTLRHLRDFGFGKTSMEGMILEEVDEFLGKTLDGQEIVEVSGLFNMSSVNILWSVMGGQRFSHSDAELTKLLNLLREVFRSGNVTGGLFALFPFLRKVFPKSSGKASDDALRTFLEKAISEHMQTRDKDFNRDFIDLYLNEIKLHEKEEDPSFVFNTLKAICVDLFVAGAESIGNSLGFAVLHLVLYPEWQQKLQLEIQSVIGTQPPSIDDKTRLPLVEAFLSEVFRCNTIAPLTVPHTTVEECTLNGYVIPKNTFILVSLWSLFQDKAHWGDPENFRPDRFLNKDGLYKRDPWLHQFGLGKRICLGESLARSVLHLFFISLVQRFELTTPQGDPKPSDVCLPGFTVAPQPFRVALKKRI